MGRLKYPLDLNEVASDYITFSHFEWKLNRSLPGGGVGTYGSGDPPSVGNTIVLYIPNSLPAMNQQNNWQADTQPGELGQVKRNISAAAAGVSYANNVGDAAKRAAEGLSGALSKEGIGSGFSALRQAIVEGVAEGLGQNAGTIIALGTGKILNPNVEVVYQGPTLRRFFLNFTFAPKDSQEARAIKDIIYEFKYWSSAAGPEQVGGMLKVPHVWRVKYKGIFEKNVNPFKRAVLNSVNVDYNAGLNTHMTFDDGEPVIINLALSFLETDYILQTDHDEVRGQGFLGGH